MSVRVFWMTDPEADAIESPFVRQSDYNDLENRLTMAHDTLDYFGHSPPSEGMMTGKSRIGTLERENKDLLGRIHAFEASLREIPICKGCGKPWPNYLIAEGPHGCSPPSGGEK